MIGADQLMSFDISQQEMAAAAGIGAALSVLKSAIASKLGAGSPDLFE
jgi:hypothetical protein